MKKIILSQIINYVISITALIISSLSFLLPLFRSRLVIEDPAVIYTIKSKNNYDELVVPIICNNYGDYIRSINKMECFLSYDDKEIPMSPSYFYNEIDKNFENKSPYSTFVVDKNTGIVKYVGFKFNDRNFTNKTKVPAEFHFEPNKLYTFHMRFYTTQNSFFKNSVQVIQVIEAFETNSDVESSDFNVSANNWFKITDVHNSPVKK